MKDFKEGTEPRLFLGKNECGSKLIMKIILCYSCRLESKVDGFTSIAFS